MQINDAEIKAAGLDPAEVKRIASGLNRYAKQAHAYGIQIFGGSTGGSLRFDDGGPGQLIIADIDGEWSGGDGASWEADDGLLRSEI